MMIPWQLRVGVSATVEGYEEQVPVVMCVDGCRSDGVSRVPACMSGHSGCCQCCCQ